VEFEFGGAGMTVLPSVALTVRLCAGGDWATGV
jgi:hypothetical protein